MTTGPIADFSSLISGPPERCTACRQVTGIVSHKEFYGRIPYRICGECMTVFLALNADGVQQFRQMMWERAVLDHQTPAGSA